MSEKTHKGNPNKTKLNPEHDYKNQQNYQGPHTHTHLERRQSNSKSS